MSKLFLYKHLDKSRLKRDFGELLDAQLRQEILEAIRFQFGM